MGQYRTAQICLNCHLITDSADSHPELQKKFCIKCGMPTIMTCPDCNAKILGDYHVPGVLNFSSNTVVPAFCNNCGKPYPWTKEKLSVANEILELDSSLTEDDRHELSVNMQDLLSDNPRTQLAAMKFKKFISKAGSSTASAIRDILVDIASETAKKIIWPD